MHARRMIPATIGTIGMAAASFTALGVGPAAAAPTCQLTVKSVKALDLVERNTDQTSLTLGGTKTATLSYTLNQRRTNLGSKAFQNPVKIKVVEHNNGQRTTVGTISGITCVNTPATVVDVAGFGAIYRVKYTVS